MDTNISYSNPKGYIANMPKNIILIIVMVILLIALGVAGYFYWFNLKKYETKNALENVSNTAEEITNSATKGILPSIQTNILENKPDVNPADKANPFKDIRTNPF